MIKEPSMPGPEREINPEMLAILETIKRTFKILKGATEWESKSESRIEEKDYNLENKDQLEESRKNKFRASFFQYLTMARGVLMNIEKLDNEFYDKENISELSKEVFSFLMKKQSQRGEDTTKEEIEFADEKIKQIMDLAEEIIKKYEK